MGLPKGEGALRGWGDWYHDRYVACVIYRAKQAIELRLRASEFLDWVVALIPAPRKSRHRCFRVLAPNSPWRTLVTTQGGWKLTAGSKAPRPRPVLEVAGATRTGKGARYVWA